MALGQGAPSDDSFCHVQDKTKNFQEVRSEFMQP